MLFNLLMVSSRETEVTLDDLLQEYDPKPFSDYIIQTAKEKLAHNPELAQRAGIVSFNTLINLKFAYPS